jgi:hypothetical protein
MMTRMESVTDFMNMRRACLRIYVAAASFQGMLNELQRRLVRTVCAISYIGRLASRRGARHV